ncbi:alkaline phosphatase D family protein [Myxococcus sp. RHSTA-1-4]|uniref:alkaline phosphatase D family protein n=1 Tax=Myxococcus sp. RHSTA-1-4 TaxID=2874601 RepID=UPI001CBCB545|nr:alkaline phosphatase D family protein [Myxococcus sp. RHSTA-1-4]
MLAAALLSLGAGGILSPGSALAGIACPPQARYQPALLMPATAGGTNVAGDRFGGAVAWGDFNRDGYQDLVVGAPEDEVGTVRSGAVFIFPGSSTGVGTGTVLTQSAGGGSNEPGDRFGYALATGDFNNDGYDDLVVGAPFENRGATDDGVIYVFHGSATGLHGGTFKDQEVLGGVMESSDQLGYALAAGDFNHDGYDDVAASAPNEDGSGVVFILRGSGAGLQAWSIKSQSHGGGSNTAGDRFGHALAAGDHNGDGYDDLFIGVPYEDMEQEGITDSGVVFLFRGSGTGLNTGGWFSQTEAGGGDEPGDHFGAALALGDFNKDGKADLVVGAPDEAPGGFPRGGSIFVFPGTAGSLSGYWRSQENSGGDPVELSDGFGRALAAGDVDADGYDDLVVGAPNESPTGGVNSGAVFLYAGTPANLKTGRRLTQQELGSANEPGDGFGTALAIGDSNGDGRGDVAVGVPGEAPYSDPASGMVGVYRGLVPGLALGPVLASVTDTSVKVWARGHSARTFRVQYKPASSNVWLTSAEALFDVNKDFTAVVTLTGLAANTAYDYRPVVDCDADSQSQATVGTLRTPGTAGTFRFAFGADVSAGWIYEPNPAKSAQVEIFDRVSEKNPDFMLLIGDLMYADAGEDATTYEQFLARYRQNWAQASFRSLLRQSPMFMMWDDHEILNDWDNGKTGRYVPARAAYDVYVASQTPAPRTAGELYYSFRVGQADFYVLDTRSFRTQNTPTNDVGETMLGAAQKADLKAWLSASTAKFKFLVSSVPWNDFAVTNSDAWEGFKAERAEIFNHIKNNNIRGVVLLSGDQHWSGVFKLSAIAPYNLYEFMPTPVATSHLDASTSEDPQVLFRHDATPVYAVFDVNTTVSPATLTVRYYDVNNAVVYGPMTLTENSISP